MRLPRHEAPASSHRNAGPRRLPWRLAGPRLLAPDPLLLPPLRASPRMRPDSPVRRFHCLVPGPLAPI